MYKIYIHDRNSIISIGLRGIINEIINIDVVSIANIEELKSKIDSRDVITFFIEINNNGILDTTFLVEVRKEFPDLKVVIFTDYNYNEEIINISNEISLCSFLSKSANEDEIFNCLIKLF